ncbi:MAG: putative hydrolase [Thermoleophilia bacterium]|nr:putative hydrolase [Thermoleophilia bacterium]
MTGLRLRLAARVIVLDDDDRVLLVKFEFSDGRVVWTTVGGGLEPGETHEDAARRELMEEAGLEWGELGSPIWTRTHILELGIRWDGQTEIYYLIRTPAFEPRPRHSWAELNAEGVTAIRWWTLVELEAADASFGPSRLPLLLRELILNGPPAEPIDVGV